MVAAVKPVLIVGNWKMYKTIEESTQFVKELLPLIKESTDSIYLAVPFTLIKSVSDAAKESPLVIGAQNMNDAEEGAFTGEVAARMLIDAGAKFVILGHAERRRIFQETNAFINKKLKRALKDGLQPILCIGETLEEREAQKTKEVLEEQLKGCLEGIEPTELQTLILAYEPVWSIGSGLVPTKEEAEELMQMAKDLLEGLVGKTASKPILIIYGGSVTPENAKSFLDQAHIDGLLVGGASLSAVTFSKIINYPI